MAENTTWQHSTRWLAIVAGVLALLLWIPDAEAKRAKGSKGPKVPTSVAKSPACDVQAHPKITGVSPDPVKPGQKVTIKGKNFGTKACFQQVSFGRNDTKHFQYVNDSTVVATVPDVKPGLVPVNILTAGGSSEYVLLIEKGGASVSKKASKKVSRKKKVTSKKKARSKKAKKSIKSKRAKRSKRR